MAIGTKPLYIGLPTLPPDVQRLVDLIDKSVEHLMACPDKPMALIALAQVSVNIAARAADPLIHSGMSVLRQQDRLNPDKPGTGGENG